MATRVVGYFSVIVAGFSCVPVCARVTSEAFFPGAVIYMRRSLLRASLLAAALAACADDSSTITETHAPNGATIIGGRDPLTPPSSAPRDVIIREFGGGWNVIDNEFLPRTRPL